MPDHLHLQPWRVQSAGATLVAAREELRGVLSPDHPEIPVLYARRILAADDEHGRRSNLIVQGDSVAGPILVELWHLASIAARAHEIDVHRGFHPECGVCGLIWATVHRSEVADLVSGFDLGNDKSAPPRP